MIFFETLRKIVTLVSEQVIVTEADEVLIGYKKLISVIKTIIGDILLLCINLEAILVYIQFVLKLFQKYRVSFWLDMCDFLKKRVEYVGPDVTEDGNFPSQSKFDLIND